MYSLVGVREDPWSSSTTGLFSMSSFGDRRPCFGLFTPVDSSEVKTFGSNLSDCGWDPVRDERTWSTRVVGTGIYLLEKRLFPLSGSYTVQVKQKKVSRYFYLVGCGLYIKSSKIPYLFPLTFPTCEPFPG